VKYAREQEIPFFGICLGLQMAVIEYARNVLGMDDAMTTEIKQNAKYPVIDLMEDQKSLTIKGGTMRLGAYSCQLEPGSLAESIYGLKEITERHRHRYEVNEAYVEDLKRGGLIPSGRNAETGLVEIMELPIHPFFIGVQFHPELKSTPERPQPIFVAFVKASINYKNAQHEN